MTTPHDREARDLLREAARIVAAEQHRLDIEAAAPLHPAFIDATLDRDGSGRDWGAALIAAAALALIVGAAFAAAFGLFLLAHLIGG